MKLFLSLALCLCVSACSSMKKQDDTPRASRSTDSSQSAQMPTPEQMQAAFAKASTPTIEHDFLKGFVGTWKAKVSMWMMPDAQPETSVGRTVNTLDMQGKFLRQVYNGTFQNQPFNGIAYTGYDTIGQEFNSTWIDSMSTAMMYSSGSYSPGTKTLNLAGSMSCPLKDGKITMHSVMHLVDKNRYTLEMFGETPDGKEFKNLEIVYTKET